MKAVVCRAFGPPQSLRVEDIAPPPMGADEVRVSVHYAGVNFPDIVMVAGKYHWKPPFPFVPGMECSGVVSEVGSNVTHVKSGDRVLATIDPKFIFRGQHGSWAEEAVTPALQTFAISGRMTFEDAAAFGIAYGTSCHGLFDRGLLKAGETLLVLGAAGGVGLAGVELGAARGASVIAAAGDRTKLELAESHGASHLIDYTSEDLRTRVKEITDNRGADVVLDPVGGDAFDQSLRCMAFNGRLLTVGFTAGRIPAAPANLVLLKGCSVVGVNWGQFTRTNPEANRSNFQAMLQMYHERLLRPHVSMQFALDQISTALEALVARTASGKVLIKIR